MIEDRIKNFTDTLYQLDSLLIKNAINLIIDSLKTGNKIMLCGNGGSAADCQHFAAELVGRFAFDRPPLPAIALTTDTSILTAVSNDYSYIDIFSRQILALGNPGDILICISTSGTSDNIIKAAESAKNMGIKVISLIGSNTYALSQLSDILISINCIKTCHIQECFLFIEHYICEKVEEILYGKNKSIIS